MTKIIHLRFYFFTILIVLFSLRGEAQLSLTNAAPSATINFSSSMQASVGNGAFTAAGFSSAPTSGQLNSNAWAITGFSDGDLLYGGTLTSGDYARGATAGGITTGGIYACTASPGTAANPAFMIQSSSNDFFNNAATVTLRVKNNGTTIITQLVLSYNLFVRNDQDRGSNFNLSYSPDDATYTDVPALNYTSPVAQDALGWVIVGTAPSRSTTISGLYVTPGAYCYIRWTGGDAGGSGSRDEIGLDDISLTATYSTPCTPPSVQAVVSPFSNVLSSQMDLNFIRGNGSGGVVIVASTSATLSSNPVSGVTYTGNTNFGNGTALGGGFVVYRGPAAGTLASASITISGLSPATTYYFYLFEYDVTVPCYTTTAATANQTTAAGSATNPTDYFRSRISGNWNNAGSWESSPTGLPPWNTATIKPTLSAKGITILFGHTITITADETSKMLNIAAGGKLTYANTSGGGYNLDIAADPAGVDLQVYGTYELYGIMPVLASGATVEVYSGGLVSVKGNAGNTTADDFARLATVLFKTGSVYDWNNTIPFETTSRTYFPAAGTEIATFRISQSIAGILGANTFTTINGLFEVNATASFTNTGVKTFRNGIIGTGTLNQSAAFEFVIDGATAQIGGTGTINLNASGRLRIAAGSVTSMISNKTINAGPITVDGTLNTGSANPSYIISGTASFALSAAASIFIGSADGITSSGLLGNVQVSGSRTYDNAANYTYYSAAVNQNTGNGLPVTITTGFLTISNTGGAGNNTVTLITNNTTVTTFNLAGGLFAAGTAQNLKIEVGGTLTGSGGNQSQAATAGIIYFKGAGTIVSPAPGLSLTNVELHGTVNMGGATTIIQGTLNIAASGLVAAGTAPYYSSSPSASTLLYSCNCNYPAAAEWTPNTFGNVAGVPNNVTLAAGTSMNFTNAATREMHGNMTINTGSTLTLSTVAGSDLNIMGNWFRDAGGFFVHNNKTVRFNGPGGTQWITVTGGGTETFAYIIVNKTAGQSLMLAAAPNATAVTVNGGIGGYALQLQNGNLDLNQQTFTLNGFNSGSINDFGIDGSAGNLTRYILSNSGTGIFAVNNPDVATHFTTVTRLSANASLLELGSTVTMTVAGIGPGSGGVNFGNAVTTINGTLKLNTNGYVTTNAPTYATGSFLIYNSGGTFNRKDEWNSLSNPGYPYNVTVQNNTNLVLNTAVNGNGDEALASNLLISAGSALNIGAYANTLTVKGNIAIDGGLALATVSGGDIYIAGTWNRSATGIFTPNDRSVYFNGAINSTLTASGGEVFANLYLAKNSLVNGIILLDDISITKEIAITTGSFQLAAKNVTLVSNAAGTASFGKFGAAGSVAYTGAGRFVVERYIPTGATHSKSWQFLAVPDNGGQTISSAWQEGFQLPTVGISNYGTIISNNIAGGGFDIIGGVGPSMKTFNPSGMGSWVGVANTNPLALYNQEGYMIFIRGDRNVSTYNGTSTPTTLRSTGKLFVPGTNPPPSTTINSGQFASIGNPYASAIDFLNFSFTAAPAIDSVYYVWDPLLTGSFGYGGFQTISSVTGYKPTPGGTANYNSGISYTRIQSGQAFLMHATGAGGTVSFTENAKVSGSNMVYRHTVPTQRQFLRAQLFNGSGNMATMLDGNTIAFDHSFSNDYDAMDALKVTNATENFGIAINDKILTVEARRTVIRRDTIFYSLSNFHLQTYEFRFGPENMDESPAAAFLEDRFLHIKTPVSLHDSSFIDFTITSDPASAASDRFMLVFQRNRHANNDSTIMVPGEITRSKGMTTPTAVTGISVYPNPVVDKTIQLSFQNKPAGKYKIRLLGTSGQLLKEQDLQLNSDNYTESFPVKTVSAGTYNLLIISEDATRTMLTIVIR